MRGCLVQDKNNQEINYLCSNVENNKIAMYYTFYLNLIKEGQTYFNKSIKDTITVELSSYSKKQGISHSQKFHTLTENIDINFKTYGCILNTTNINFNLGKQQQEKFTGIGPIGSGETKPIALTCDPDTKYSLQVDGITESNYSDVIELTQNSGAATGVGVQLLANNKPVQLNHAQYIATTTNGNTDSPQSIDITARYYQTADKVTPGSTNASATFTLTYQ